MIIHRARHIIQLLLIYSIFLISGIFLIRFFSISISVAIYSSTATFFVIITLGAYLLFVAGVKKGEEKRGLFLLAALGGKFVSYLILILIYWIALKNLSIEFIVAFFILYLVFTIFLISIFYKMLKTN